MKQFNTFKSLKNYLEKSQDFYLDPYSKIKDNNWQILSYKEAGFAIFAHSQRQLLQEWNDFVHEQSLYFG